MTEAIDNNYELTIEDNVLRFRTASFRAEKTSVLHGGVYTREFSSMLFASALCMAVYIMMLSYIYIAIIQYLILAAVFVLAFVLSHRFIFKKRILEADFDRQSATVTLINPGLLRGKVEHIPYSGIKSIEIGSREFVPQNRDGIDFVQKISLQHGSAMPELSEVEEFVTLSLKLRDGSERTIYAGKASEEPSIPLNEINNFFINKEE